MFFRESGDSGKKQSMRPIGRLGVPIGRSWTHNETRGVVVYVVFGIMCVVGGMLGLDNFDTLNIDPALPFCVCVRAKVERKIKKTERRWTEREGEQGAEREVE